MAAPLWNPLSQSMMAASGAGFPIKFGSTGAAYDEAAPLPGAHTIEILSRLAKLDAGQIAELRAAKAI